MKKILIILCATDVQQKKAKNSHIKNFINNKNNNNNKNKKKRGGEKMSLKIDVCPHCKQAKIEYDFLRMIVSTETRIYGEIKFYRTRTQIYVFDMYELYEKGYYDDKLEVMKNHCKELKSTFEFQDLEQGDILVDDEGNLYIVFSEIYEMFVRKGFVFIKLDKRGEELFIKRYGEDFTKWHKFMQPLCVINDEFYREEYKLSLEEFQKYHGGDEK